MGLRNSLLVLPLPPLPLPPPLPPPLPLALIETAVVATGEAAGGWPRVAMIPERSSRDSNRSTAEGLNRRCFRPIAPSPRPLRAPLDVETARPAVPPRNRPASPSGNRATGLPP